jgi:hypothetical protein
MVRIDLDNAIANLNGEIARCGDGRKGVTITSLANAIGIHRKTLYKIKNKPNWRVRTDQLDKIIEFFFIAYRGLPENRSLTDEVLMRKVIVTLVTAFPNDSSFWHDIDKRFGTPENPSGQAFPRALWASRS